MEEPGIDPLARKVNASGGIMAIVDHIGRHEHPLREGRGIDISGRVIDEAQGGRRPRRSNRRRW